MKTNDITYIKEIFHKLKDSVIWEDVMFYKFDKRNVSESALEKPARIDAYILILCTDGEIYLENNSGRYTLSQGMIFISSPYSMINSVTGKDPKGYIIAMNKDRLINHIGSLNIDISTIHRIHEFPIIKLETQKFTNVTRGFENIMTMILEDSIVHFKKQIVGNSINLLLFLLAEYTYEINSKLTLSDTKKSKYSEHFIKFIRILSENYTRERDVAFYADKMCLTSRHLTTLVRKVSGSTISDWIIKFVINDAKYLLSHTQLTVKEISYQLNFPNQSFFCKYFKKHTGSSPLEYRNSH